MTRDRRTRSKPPEATISIRLPDPHVEGLYVPEAKDPEKERLTIEKFKANLSSCRVTLDRVGLSPEKFLSDLRGIFTLKVRGQTFVILRTENREKGESRFYAQYPETHETMHDRIPGLMDAVDLRNNFHLQMPSGKTLFFSWITKAHYMNLLSIADKPSVAKKEDTLAIGEGRFDSADSLKAKLASLGDVASEYLFFDFRSFVESISFVAPDRGSAPHYYIETADSAYLLFVNGESPPSESRKEIARFKYRNDSCVLYLET